MKELNIIDGSLKIISSEIVFECLLNKCFLDFRNSFFYLESSSFIFQKFNIEISQQRNDFLFEVQQNSDLKFTVLLIIFIIHLINYLNRIAPF